VFTTHNFILYTYIDFDSFRKHGKGKCTYSDGDIYEGNYSDDMRNGYGVYKYTNGNIYWGNYVNDVRSGKGKSEFITGGGVYNWLTMSSIMSCMCYRRVRRRLQG
jgi:hypothetical protein